MRYSSSWKLGYEVRHTTMELEVMNTIQTYKVFEQNCEHCATPEDCVEMYNRVTRIIENLDEYVYNSSNKLEVISHIRAIAQGISH